MSHILEVDPQGDLFIPASLVEQLSPGKRYFLEIQGETLILKPASASLNHQPANNQPANNQPANNQPANRQPVTPQERIDRLRAWASQPRPGNPHITDEALRREHFYDA